MSLKPDVALAATKTELLPASNKQRSESSGNISQQQTITVTKIFAKKKLMEMKNFQQQKDKTKNHKKKQMKICLAPMHRKISS